MPSILGSIGAIIAFIIAWIVISIPTWLAGKVVAPRTTTFGRAMLATLIGVIVYAIFTALFSLISPIIGVIIGFIAFLGVYKVVFNTGWVQALGIAILAIIVAIIILFILGLIGITLPHFFPIL
ncbi:MAG: hypothetical protein QXY87_12045 [Saccharolobus sp.]|uniref:Integral membrane protein n=2 Tax=Saccharolobus shibatae TaxID=2286 RepID=A0A8F5GSN2_SACSH|nr:hypothetical protein [Saccharolobus shibatae]MCH4815938.1 hypothetical protein [Saccharolobus shibatae]QXJ28035.1 putative integral membrane protein [Saccharolobus shibatae B12]QXJ31358.1 putative integral membrane protein [Saccharolobus shibatae]QXJ34376.1 putative integral membrane protein [Saccharolobus shibatae]